MEPRPPSSRSAHEQPHSRHTPSGSGHGAEETRRYQPQSDPNAPVVPPRADYDYSPLDLAPPGQRRRRQLVAATLGGLVVLLLISAAVFAFLVLRDDGEDEDLNIAAVSTETTSSANANQQGTPDGLESGALVDLDDEVAVGESAQENTGENPDTAENDATTTLDEAGDQAALEPTVAVVGDTNPAGDGGLTEQELQALLPAQDIMPQGLVADADVSRTQEDVVAALGGTREAETNLDTWGWTGNVERSFTAPDPAALGPDATTQIIVSIHGFSSDAAAAEALTFYSDIVVAGGYEEVEAGQIGDSNRLLVQPTEEGGTNVAFYVQDGPVLYRIGGYSPGGDPVQNAINVAQSLVGQQ